MLSPEASTCSARLQVASYSTTNATLATIVNSPRRAAINNAAEAPDGLRNAATMTSVSRTHCMSHVTLHQWRK